MPNIPPNHLVDAATVSAFAAAAAAIAATAVAAIQLYVGHRQTRAALRSAEAALLTATSAGRHTVATFRQTWIDKVMDTLCEYHSIVLTAGSPPTDADIRSREALRTKLEILLNPNEAETVALLDEFERVREQMDNPLVNATDVDDTRMITIARRLLKAEWVRIKSELNSDLIPASGQQG